MWIRRKKMANFLLSLLVYFYIKIVNVLKAYFCSNAPQSNSCPYTTGLQSGISAFNQLVRDSECGVTLLSVCSTDICRETTTWENVAGISNGPQRFSRGKPFLHRPFVDK